VNLRHNAIKMSVYQILHFFPNRAKSKHNEKERESKRFGTKNVENLTWVKKTNEKEGVISYNRRKVASYGKTQKGYFHETSDDRWLKTPQITLYSIPFKDSVVILKAFFTKYRNFSPSYIIHTYLVKKFPACFCETRNFHN
jgi:hypothetical protein